MTERRKRQLQDGQKRANCHWQGCRRDEIDKPRAGNKASPFVPDDAAEAA